MKVVGIFSSCSRGARSRGAFILLCCCVVVKCTSLVVVVERSTIGEFHCVNLVERLTTYL